MSIRRLCTACLPNIDIASRLPTIKMYDETTCNLSKATAKEKLYHYSQVLLNRIKAVVQICLYSPERFADNSHHFSVQNLHFATYNQLEALCRYSQGSLSRIFQECFEQDTKTTGYGLVKVGPMKQQHRAVFEQLCLRLNPEDIKTIESRVIGGQPVLAKAFNQYATYHYTHYSKDRKQWGELICHHAVEHKVFDEAWMLKAAAGQDFVGKLTADQLLELFDATHSAKPADVKELKQSLCEIIAKEASSGHAASKRKLIETIGKIMWLSQEHFNLLTGRFSTQDFLTLLDPALEAFSTIKLMAYAALGRRKEEAADVVEKWLETGLNVLPFSYNCFFDTPAYNTVDEVHGIALIQNKAHAIAKRLLLVGQFDQRYATQYFLERNFELKELLSFELSLVTYEKLNPKAQNEYREHCAEHDPAKLVKLLDTIKRIYPGANGTGRLGVNRFTRFDTEEKILGCLAGRIASLPDPVKKDLREICDVLKSSPRFTDPLVTTDDNIKTYVNSILAHS